MLYFAFFTENLMELLNILKGFMSHLNARGNCFLMKQQISPVSHCPITGL